MLLIKVHICDFGDYMDNRVCVSVIVPIYNVELYLNKCINSIINQTYKNLEIILVDDGSTDTSGYIAENYASIDDRIFVIHKKNEGLSVARNYGLDFATGDWIAFVDSDDWINERFIECMLQVAKDYECEIVQCDMLKPTLDGDFIDQYARCPIIFDNISFLKASYDLLKVKNNFVWNKIYKKALFDEIRFPHFKLHEDEFTTYKLIWRCKKIGYISNKLYYYRQRYGSIMGNAFDNKNLDALEASKEKADFFHDIGLFELEDKELLYRERWLYEKINYVNNNIDKYINNSIKNILGIEYELILKIIKNKNLIPLEKHCVLFPFDCVNREDKIVLYGAGYVGKAFWSQITENNYCNIVLWTDSNWEKKIGENLPVAKLDLLKVIEYDKIIISIDSNEIALKLISNLINEFGVDANKILYRIYRY